jgi:hypothetical protein
MVPAEREAGRRINRLHHDRAALVPEPHVAVRAGLHDQVHLVGEPFAHLIGLGDGAPHHLGRRLDQNVLLNHQAGHRSRLLAGHRLLISNCNRR